MANFGVRVMFILSGESKRDVVNQVAEFLAAGTDGTGIEINAAAIEVASLPDDMDGDRVEAAETREEQVASHLHERRN
jgi:hypothetical protein